MQNFEFASPRSEAEVLALLASASGPAEVLAGGIDLTPLLQKSIVRPARVVNILEVPSLKTIEQLDGGVVAIGAAVTLDELLEHPYLQPFAAVRQAVEYISSWQIQCQGTLGGEMLQRPQCWFFREGRGLLAGGGSLAEAGDNRFHAILGNEGPAKFVSASRLAPALIALGAQARVIGPEVDAEETVPLANLFRTPRHEGERENTLRKGQLLTHILLPHAEGLATATYEVKHGEGPEYPLAAAAAVLRMDGSQVAEAKLVLGHVAPTPWLAENAAAALLGRPLTAETAELAGEIAVSQARPLANNAYKVQLAKVAVKRALLRAAGIETGGF